MPPKYMFLTHYKKTVPAAIYQHSFPLNYLKIPHLAPQLSNSSFGATKINGYPSIHFLGWEIIPKEKT